jgi:hypothetical protein
LVSRVHETISNLRTFGLFDLEEAIPESDSFCLARLAQSREILYLHRELGSGAGI